MIRRLRRYASRFLAGLPYFRSDLIGYIYEVDEFLRPRR